MRGDRASFGPLAGRDLLIAAGLALAAFAVYGQTRSFAFVNFDDDLYVYNNAFVKAGISPSAIGPALHSTDPYYWHPLTMLSHAADWSLYGAWAGGHHLTNVLLHIIASVLLYFALRQLAGAVWRSAVAAALFAVHPLHVESVAWVAERKDVLCAVFWFATMLVYAAFARRRNARRYAALILCFVLALMAKPMAVSLPLALLILDYWPLGRWKRENAWGLALEKLPMVVIAIAVSLVTYQTQARYGADRLLGELSLSLRAANAVAAYAAYLAKTVWPRDLSPIYPYRMDLPWWEIAASLAVLAGITGFAIEMRRKAPYLAAGWFWFLLVLAPTVGIIQVGYQPYADRFVYIPHVGLFAAAVWGAAELANRYRVHRAAAAAVAAAVLLVFAVAAQAQARHWRDGVALFSHAVSVTRENYVAQTLLGYALQQDKRSAEAAGHFREAIRIHPDYAMAHNNLGSVLAEQGKLGEALVHFDAAARLMPGFGSAQYNRAMALLKSNQPAEALEAIDAALLCDLPDAARRELTAARKGLWHLRKK